MHTHARTHAHAQIMHKGTRACTAHTRHAHIYRTHSTHIGARTKAYAPRRVVKSNSAVGGTAVRLIFESPTGPVVIVMSVMCCDGVGNNDIDDDML